MVITCPSGSRIQSTTGDGIPSIPCGAGSWSPSPGAAPPSAWMGSRIHGSRWGDGGSRSHRRLCIECCDGQGDVRNSADAYGPAEMEVARGVGLNRPFKQDYFKKGCIIESTRAPASTDPGTPFGRRDVGVRSLRGGRSSTHADRLKGVIGMPKAVTIRGPFFDCRYCGALVQAKVKRPGVVECPVCGADVEVWPVEPKVPALV